MEIKQSTARNVMVFMADSTDHMTGKAGLTLTITASKDGAAFASIAPTVTERGTGWYNLALTAAHTDTLGDFCLHVTSTGADPADVRINVVANLEADTYTRLGAPAGASIAEDIAAMDTLIDRLLGLSLENHVEDDITRNASGLKTASVIYCYNSAANATTHDKATGLIASYTASVTYDANNRMSRFKVVKN